MQTVTLPAMPDNMTVHVTQSDIINGRKCVSSECPIALAIIRAFREAEVNISWVSVGPWSAHIDQDTGRRDESGYKAVLTTKYTLPTEAAEFVGLFDNGDRSNVQPFDFEMNISDSYRNFRS